MARLGSQAKAGFYPTPEKVSNQLRQLLDIEEHARLLDPCCGQGKTLDTLAEESNCTTYGMELDHHRATEARSKLTRVLWTDALVEARVSSASFGLLYLNPPYDYAMTPDTRSERLEVQFLKRYHNVLQRDGWLILVIPYTVLKFCAALLARHFEMLQVFAFPEEEFQAFNQCVVLGRKRPLAGRDQVQETEHGLVRLADRYPDEFLEIVPGLEQCASPMTIPASGGPLTTFKSTRIDPLEAVPLVRKSGLLDDVLRDLTPRPCNTIRPLAPLENGHLALMLAGGYMNGEIELNGRRLVIKGVVSKMERVQSVQENASGASTIVTRDKYVPTVKAVDMVRAELLTIR